MPPPRRRYGPLAAVCLSGAFEISGLLLLAFANSKSFDTFIPAVLCLATGGLLIMLSAFPISFRCVRRGLDG